MLSVLLVTETADLAADLLVLAASRQGLPLYRLNLDEFPRQATITWSAEHGVSIADNASEFGEDDIAGAWFRRMPSKISVRDPIETFVARESTAFFGGLFEAVSWPWMNRPTAALRAEYKILQLHEAKRVGITIPDTLAGNNAAAARGLADKRSIIAKTLAGGQLTINGTPHAVFTSPIELGDLLDDAPIRSCPAIFQQRIVIAFDLRVTVVGEQIFAVRIITADRTDADLDWRQADPWRIRYETCTLCVSLQRRVLSLVAGLGLRYGALDFIVSDRGEYFFLEINPAGQWGWIERATGLPITAAILDELREGR